MSNISDALGDDVETVVFELPSADGPVEFEVEAPTPEQLFLLATDTNSAKAMMTFLQQLVGEREYASIRRRLGLSRSDPDRLKVEDLTVVVEQLMEVRSGFPTVSPSGSSQSQKPIGRRSTGRVRSGESNPSASVPVAS